MDTSTGTEDFPPAIWRGPRPLLARHSAALILGCILLASLLYRVHIARVCSLSLDEVTTLREILKPWRTVLNGPSREHPPLMYVLVRLATSVLGTGELGLRSWSLFFGCVLLFSVYELCLTLGFGPARALIVTATLALHPFFIRHATECRQYGMMMAFATLATSRALRFLRGPQRVRDLLGFAIVAVAAAATQYFALAYALALLVTLAIGLTLTWRAHSSWFLARAIGVLAASSVPLAFLTRRALALGRYYSASASSAGVPLFDWTLLHDIARNFSFLANDKCALVVEPALASVGLLILSRRLVGIARAVPFGLGILPCIAAPFISAQHFIAARYLAPSAVVYHLGASCALFAAWDALSSSFANRARAGLVKRYGGAAVLVIPLALRFAEYPDGFNAGEDDYRAFQQYFSQNLAADSALVTFYGYFGQIIFGLKYGVGRRPIWLERFRPVRGIQRYVVAELHCDEPDRQDELEASVERNLHISRAAWRALPRLTLPHSVYQPPVTARIVQLPEDWVPPPPRKNR